MDESTGSQYYSGFELVGNRNKEVINPRNSLWDDLKKEKNKDYKWLSNLLPEHLASGFPHKQEVKSDLRYYKMWKYPDP